MEHEHEGAFVTKSMYENLKNGDFNRVPLLIGVNSEEMDGMADSKFSLPNDNRKCGMNIFYVLQKFIFKIWLA